MCLHRFTGENYAMSKHLKHLIITVALCALLLMSTAAFAQEATEAVTEPTAVSEDLPLGVGTGILVIGLVALIIVGGIIYIRERGADTSLPKS
jgi:hypothetical protein